MVAAEGPSFFQQYGYIVWPVLGVLGGLVLLVGGYAIWRGPHRAFFPPCITKRFRKDIVGGDDAYADGMDNEKRNTPMGRVPSPVPIPIIRREESSRGRGGAGRRDTMSRADAFKQQVIIARERGSVEYGGGGSGHPQSPVQTHGHEQQYRSPQQQQQQHIHHYKPQTPRTPFEQEGPMTPMSESGTLVGSPAGMYEEKLAYDYENRYHVDGDAPDLPPTSPVDQQQQQQQLPGRPRRSSSLSQTVSPIDFNAPRPAPSPPAGAQRDGHPDRASSQRVAAPRHQQRRTQAYGSYGVSRHAKANNAMRDEQDSHVW